MPLKHYLVSGRIWKDDENTIATFEATSRDDAVSQYLVMLYGDPETARLAPHADDAAVIDTQDRTIRGYYINCVYVSDAPIEEI